VQISLICVISVLYFSREVYLGGFYHNLD